MSASTGLAIGLAPFTGGTSLAALGGSSNPAAAIAPQNIAMKAAGLDKPGGPPAAAVPPTAPNLSDAAKQAAIDEQKRAAMTGPSDITNIKGAQGILTDPNAKYVTGKLLGGA